MRRSIKSLFRPFPFHTHMYHTIILGPPNSPKKKVAQQVCSTVGGSILEPLAMLRDRSQQGGLLGEYIDNNWDPSLGPIIYQLLEETIRSHPTRHFVLLDFPIKADDWPLVLRAFSTDRLAIVNMAGYSRQELRRENLRSPLDDLLVLIKDPAEYEDRWNQYQQILAHCPPYIDYRSQEPLALLYRPLPPAHLPHMPAECKVSADLGPACIEASPIESATIVQASLRLAESHRLWRQFPGSHPIHITRSAITANLERYPYLVSKKIDGTRYLMVILLNRLWFMDRKLLVWKGPCNQAMECYNDSLLDCEVEPTGKITIIDVINARGQCVRGDNILRRLGSLKGITRTFRNSPFHVTIQHYDELSDLPRAIGELQLDKHDGLIFTPKKTGYRLGRNDNLFKWKPNEVNTIDLLYRNGQVYCQADKQLKPLGELAGTPADLVDGQIVECFPQGQYWVYIKTRTDKTNPNTDWVTDNILQSLDENIEPSDLLTIISSPRLNGAQEEEDRRRGRS